MSVLRLEGPCIELKYGMLAKYHEVTQRTRWIAESGNSNWGVRFFPGSFCLNIVQKLAFENMFSGAIYKKKIPRFFL